MQEERIIFISNVLRRPGSSAALACLLTLNQSKLGLEQCRRSASFSSPPCSAAQSRCRLSAQSALMAGQRAAMCT